jgi:hypothetical protein
MKLLTFLLLGLALLVSGAYSQPYNPQHVYGVGTADRLMKWVASGGQQATALPMTHTTNGFQEEYTGISGRTHHNISGRGIWFDYDPVAAFFNATFRVRDVARGWDNISVGPTQELVLKSGLNSNVRIDHGGGAAADYIMLFTPVQILARQSINPNGTVNLGSGPTTGGSWNQTYTNGLTVGRTTNGVSTITFENSLVGAAVLGHDSNFPGFGSGWRIFNPQGEDMMFIRDIWGANGGDVRFWPEFNFATMTGTTQQRWGWGSNAGFRGFTMRNGDTVTLPIPLRS